MRPTTTHTTASRRSLYLDQSHHRRSSSTDDPPVSPPPPERHTATSVQQPHPTRATVCPPWTFGGTRIHDADMAQWHTKLAKPLSHLREASTLVAIAGLPAPERPSYLASMQPYLSVCLTSAQKSKPGDLAALQRQSGALGNLPSRIQSIELALKNDPVDGAVIAQRLLGWTLADLLESLADPPLSADLMVAGLREGLSAAELIALHREGLSIHAVRQVRRAHAQARQPEPSLQAIVRDRASWSMDSGWLAWGLQHGFQADELVALQQAGWDEQAQDLPPRPDDLSRRLGPHLTEGITTKDGWLELRDNSSTPLPATYRFMACRRGSSELDRLGQGLCVQALARLLGVPQRVVPLRAHVHPAPSGPLYGVLMGPMPAQHLSSGPPDAADRYLVQAQQAEAHWLAYLAGVEWDRKARYWTQDPANPQLCLGWVKALPDPSGDESPVRFVVWPQLPSATPALKERLGQLTLDSVEPARRWLQESGRYQMTQRVEQLRLDRVEVLPEPERRARRITRLGQAQPGLPTPPTARLPRSWVQRTAALKVGARHPITVTAEQLDRAEQLHGGVAIHGPLDQLMPWGSMQRARATLTSEVTGWDTQAFSPAERPARERARLDVLRALRGTPALRRQLSHKAHQDALAAGLDSDALLSLSSTLRVYEHLLHSALPADTALADLDALMACSRKLIAHLDRLRRDATTLPAGLEKLRKSAEQDLRALPDVQDIARELQVHHPAALAVRTTAADLLTLVQLKDATPARRQAAWRASATPADLVRVYRAPRQDGLPDTWALLAAHLLQDRARNLAQEQDPHRMPDATQVERIRQRLQIIYPLSEVATMAWRCLSAPTAPSTPSGSGSPLRSPAPRAPLPQRGSRLLRTLGWGVDLLADDGPSQQALKTAVDAYDHAWQPLAALPLNSPAIATAADAARQQLAALEQALKVLATVDQRAALADVLGQEAAALERLPAVAPGLGSDGTVADLLPLLVPDGPDPQWLLHGHLAGWSLAEAARAHADRLPAWVMDLDRSADTARERLRDPALPRRMSGLAQQLALRPGE